MSEAALIESIRVEMKMLCEAGARYLVMTPGNYGEVFSKEQMDLDLTYSMKCSNYIGETLEMAAGLGVKGILFISHIGKFIKVSGGHHEHPFPSRGQPCRADGGTGLACGCRPYLCETRAGDDNDGRSAGYSEKSTIFWMRQCVLPWKRYSII